MKKKTIILWIIGTIILISIIIGGIYWVKSRENESLTSTEGIKVALTMQDKIEKDSIWCGTFQLIWNDLKNELAKQDITFEHPSTVVDNLNRGDFTIKELSEDSYYKKYGTPSMELKREIEKAIEEKFKETSDILDDFDWSGRDSRDYFLYVMLKKEFEFEKEFEELPKGDFAGKYKDITYFGIQDSSKEEIRRQVKVWYYHSKNDFAIQLETKQGEEVILCRTEEGDTFDTIYNDMNKEKEGYTGQKAINSLDEVKIPNISVKEKREIKEVENQEFYFANGQSYMIEKALQTIEFDLDKKGGRIKSEAGMMNKAMSAVIPDKVKKREFFLDDTFVLFLQEEGKEKPYFAARIQDITKFQ